MSTTSITIGARISEDLDGDLRRLASATGRSRSRLIADAIRSYVDSEKEFLAAVEEGIEALEQGRLVDHEVLATEFRRRLKA